jgi:hypothetical protein
LLVIKLFDEFSSGAKKLDEFKASFIFLETEYSVPTRFLSLFAALDSFLETGQ